MILFIILNLHNLVMLVFHHDLKEGILLHKKRTWHWNSFRWELLGDAIVHAFFVSPYSYPNSKVLYEDHLISSHIFIPADPSTWPLPFLGWERPILNKMVCGRCFQLLVRLSNKIRTLACSIFRILTPQDDHK